MRPGPMPTRFNASVQTVSLGEGVVFTYTFHLWNTAAETQKSDEK